MVDMNIYFVNIFSQSVVSFLIFMTASFIEKRFTF